MTAPVESSIVTEWRADDDDPLAQIRFATLTYVYVAPPVLMNPAMRMHHRTRDEHTAEWRDAFADMAEHSPRLDWCNVTVHHEHRTAKVPDCAATAFVAKAALDGITRHVLVDDGPAYVRSVTFTAPVFTGRDALILVLDGPEKETP